jgi:Flp pilus assembly protein TadG
MSNSLVTRRSRQKERGQTIVLVAVALVGLLGMAALAIDVTTLYVAKGELQRAADAAALAGAKAFVDSGVTSDNSVTRQGMAQVMITSLVNSALAQNTVSGGAPVLVAATPDFTRAGNPQLSVTLQKANLPSFFSRIWGTKVITANATAIAEAYNPANAPAGYPPIAPKCVKPILVTNQDPASGTPFVNTTTGAVTASALGEQVNLKPCPAGACATGTDLRFRPAQVVASAANLCPGTCTPPASDYETSIDCCDSATIYQCGNLTPTPPVNVTPLGDPQLSTQTNNGLQCVTNHPSEDTLDATTIPGFSSGTNPVAIIAGSGPHLGNVVTTSRSIATLPIVENPDVPNLRVVGFLQVFVDPVVTATVPTHTPVHILNVIGCGNSPGAPPAVLGGGFSPIPVRLIH